MSLSNTWFLCASSTSRPSQMCNLSRAALMAVVMMPLTTHVNLTLVMMAVSNRRRECQPQIG